MVRTGSLVRYRGTDKRLWDGKLLMVHEVKNGKLVAYRERKPNGDWTTITINEKDVEVVVQ